MKFVYLAHPYISDPKANLERINKIAERIVKYQLINITEEVEYIPFVPHNILSVFSEDNNPQIRGTTEEASRLMVRFCSELWLCSPKVSKGMEMEIEVAKDRKMPIIPYEEIQERFEISGS